MSSIISERTLQEIAKAVTGDGGISPYRSGPKLVRYFNALGANDVYPQGGGFPSRWAFAEEKLRALNGSSALVSAIEGAVNPAEYLGTTHDVAAVAAHLNTYLAFDGFELRSEGGAWRLRARGASTVRVQSLGAPADPLTHEFIHEQIAKCERKLGESDHDGAITNARALVEGVLREIEHRARGAATDTKGDLGRQFKEVQRILHLEPDRKDIDGALKQMLTGLVSIVNGIAAARNAMSDAHARTYRPAAHHARLVVNAAQTLADFLLAAYEAQRERGMVDTRGGES
jgi:hypothetical protein